MDPGTPSSRRLVARRLFVIALGSLLAWLEATAAVGQDVQKRVLVLYATRRDAQIVVVGDRELQKMFSEGLPGGVDYYSEYLDQARFTHAEFATAFRDSLRLKYQLQRFDLVIAIGNIPLDFVDQNREMFGAAPIVFFSERAPARRPANATGLVVPVNLRGTLDLAAALQPDLRNVFVIAGVGEPYLTEVRTQIVSDSRFAVTVLSGLRTAELESRLASLPDRSAVYYLRVDRDGADQLFRPLDYLDRVTAVASAPVYSWVDSTLDHGVVGGSLKDQTVEMQAIGELALRVLRGEPAESIPPVARDLNVNQVDWRQLARWGISERRVPPATIVRFKEPSALDLYKVYILGAAAALLAQTALIAGLLVLRLRRRQAEQAVRNGQAALRTSYDRIRDLGARLLKAQETERARIARELHDDIGQQLARLQIDLELMGRGDGGDTFREVLHRAQLIGKSMHDLSHRLHPAKLRLIGLSAALESLPRELSQSGVDITFTHHDVPPSLPPDLTLCLFRIAQEALHNAIGHGRARHVSMNLHGGSRLALTIVDDGSGFDVNTAWGKGLGLISMQERVEAIGGTFSIHSTMGGGTRLEVAVSPQPRENSEAVSE
jgi:signal transduction histidine kinase